MRIHTPPAKLALAAFLAFATTHVAASSSGLKSRADLAGRTLKIEDLEHFPAHEKRDLLCSLFDICASVSAEASVSVGLDVTVPAVGFVCNGKGTDGYKVDYLGASRPNTVPEDFLWFGIAIGWAPPVGFELSLWADLEIIVDLEVKVQLWTWWTPPSSVSVPGSFKGCSWWGSSSRVSLPSASFKCSGTGLDGWKYDNKGNSCPSKYPVGFLWYGQAIGWAPPPSWTLSEWVDITSIVDIDVSLGLWLWWSPPASLAIPSKITHRSWWPAVGLPSASFTCNGSGNDGYKFDHEGNSCPSKYPSGWLWFGESLGWLPPVGWTFTSWDELTVVVDIEVIITVAVWWSPPAAQCATIPSSIIIPSHWPTTWPSSSWQCNGSGSDGKDKDDNGNSCPDSFPSGWKWWGSKAGWGPPPDWVVPSVEWILPSSCTTTVIVEWTWWQPGRASWPAPSGRSCPKWWPQAGPTHVSSLTTATQTLGPSTISVISCVPVTATPVLSSSSSTRVSTTSAPTSSSSTTSSAPSSTSSPCDELPSSSAAASSTTPAVTPVATTTTQAPSSSSTPPAVSSSSSSSTNSPCDESSSSTPAQSVSTTPSSAAGASVTPTPNGGGGAATITGETGETVTLTEGGGATTVTLTGGQDFTTTQTEAFTITLPGNGGSGPLTVTGATTLLFTTTLVEGTTQTVFVGPTHTPAPSSKAEKTSTSTKKLVTHTRKAHTTAHHTTTHVPKLSTRTHHTTVTSHHSTDVAHCHAKPTTTVYVLHETVVTEPTCKPKRSLW